MNRIYSLNDILNALNGVVPQTRQNDNLQSWWNKFIEPCEPEIKEMGQESLKFPERNAFNLAEDIKQRRERIAREQAALEEAEKQYDEQCKKIRYIGDDKKLQMLVPREKMLQLIKGLTEVLKKEPDAKNYKITINLD